MTDHPPPAPDWILGPDGHWRPPPFDVGRPSGPPPGGASPPPFPPMGPGGPPPTPPGAGSSGRTVAVVLGAVGIGAVALVVTCLAAVTFLGTTQPEPTGVRLTPADLDAPAAGDDPGGTVPPTDTGIGTGAAGGADPADAGAAGSEAVAVEIADQLEDIGWVVTGAEPIDFAETGAPCMPAGWHDGIADGFRVSFHADGIGEAYVAASAYDSEALAEADLVRASSEQYRACLEQSAEEHSAVDVTTVALPADPSIPGITHRSTAVDAQGPLVQDDSQIVVGNVRAHVSYCTCEALDEAHRRQVAQQVAAAIAEAQGLPRPG